MMRYPTGFCESGWHEGDKPRSFSGKPAPSCKEFMKCPCDCHQNIWVMFEMTGRDRILVDNSDYRPERVIVFVDEIKPVEMPATVSSIPGVPNHTPAAKSPAPGIVPPAAPRIFDPTPTGRSARGELEAWVREVTDIWAVERDVVCSPNYVSTEIGRRKGIKAPSSGAVDAVFIRWEKLGFAVIEKKPTRFTGYTEDGVRLGLDVMKERARKAARR